MTEKEVSLLESRLSKVSSYFEFGSGESTKRALAHSRITEVVSVESDAAFVDEHLRNDESVTEAENSGRLRFDIVDIGPTKRWGHPKDSSEKHKWPNYPSAIRGTDKPWQLVLVDGRFRNACLAASLLHNPDATVMVHDFWRRKRYRVMLDYCDVEDSADQLVVLRRRPEIVKEALEDFYNRFCFNPTDKTLWLAIQAKFGIKV